MCIHSRGPIFTINGCMLPLCQDCLHGIHMLAKARPLARQLLAACCWPRGAGKARIPVGWAGAAVGSSGGAKGPGKPWSMPCGGWSPGRGKEPGKPWPMLLPGNITNPGRGCSDCTWLAFCMFKRACRAAPMEPVPLKLPRVEHPALLDLQPMEACIFFTMPSKWGGQPTGGLASLYTLLYHSGKLLCSSPT